LGGPAKTGNGGGKKGKEREELKIPSMLPQMRSELGQRSSKRLYWGGTLEEGKLKKKDESVDLRRCGSDCKRGVGGLSSRGKTMRQGSVQCGPMNKFKKGGNSTGKKKKGARGKKRGKKDGLVGSIGCRSFSVT